MAKPKEGKKKSKSAKRKKEDDDADALSFEDNLVTLCNVEGSWESLCKWVKLLFTETCGKTSAPGGREVKFCAMFSFCLSIPAVLPPVEFTSAVKTFKEVFIGKNYASRDPVVIPGLQLRENAVGAGLSDACSSPKARRTVKEGRFKGNVSDLDIMDDLKPEDDHDRSGEVPEEIECSSQRPAASDSSTYFSSDLGGLDQFRVWLRQNFGFIKAVEKVEDPILGVDDPTLEHVACLQGYKCLDPVFLVEDQLDFAWVFQLFRRHKKELAENGTHKLKVWVPDDDHPDHLYHETIENITFVNIVASLFAAHLDEQFACPPFVTSDVARLTPRHLNALRDECSFSVMMLSSATSLAKGDGALVRSLRLSRKCSGLRC